MSTKPTTYSRRSPKGAKASARLAHHNTAAMALLDALRDGLTPCGPQANWADVAESAELVDALLDLLAIQRGLDESTEVVLPVDGDREKPMSFTTEAR